MRKRWSTMSLPGAGRVEHDSKAATYRWVQKQVALWSEGALRHPTLSVWFDDGDGRGWHLYERVDLREHAAAQA